MAYRSAGTRSGKGSGGLGLTDYFWCFFNGHKSNGLEHLTDQRLMEVTFGVMINV